MYSGIGRATPQKGMFSGTRLPAHLPLYVQVLRSALPALRRLRGERQPGENNSWVKNGSVSGAIWEEGCAVWLLNTVNHVS